MTVILSTVTDVLLNANLKTDSQRVAETVVSNSVRNVTTETRPQATAVTLTVVWKADSQVPADVVVTALQRSERNVTTETPIQATAVTQLAASNPPVLPV